MRCIHIFLICVLVNTFAYAQDPVLNRADEYYNGYVYAKAIRSYKKVLKKQGKSAELLTKLGNSYYFNTNFKEAESCYRDAIAMNPDIDPEIYFRYVHSLKAVKKYEEANEWMTVFSEKKPNDSRTTIFKESLDYLIDIKRRSGRYLVEPLRFNTIYNDFGPSFNQDLLVFATGINSDGSSGKKSGTDNGIGFFDLYALPLDSNRDPKTDKAYPLVGEVNTKFHESTAAFTADGKTMYFTRNNYYKGKRGKTLDGRTLLKIYKATNVAGKWVDIIELPFNNDEYSVAHPALSPDEKKLYFAYSGPGSLGLSDIFVVDILGRNSYSKPKSLGSKINTDGRESFPFITKSNLLFYASNGKQGLGALDIYLADLNSVGEDYFDAFNIGAPINSEKDDFGFILDEDSDKGFFSSNREGGKGEDDIYGFIRRKEFNVKCEGIIKGIAKNATDFVVLSETTIVLLDSNGNEIQRVTSDKEGKFAFNIEECRDDILYNLRAMMGRGEESELEEVLYDKDEEGDFLDVNFRFKDDDKDWNSVNDKEGSKDDDKDKNKNKNDIEEDQDITNLFNFEPIYFDFGNAKIRPRETSKLLKIIYFLRENPKIRIVVEAHTDSRSGDEFNLKLSERRAKATKKYLVNWKIDPERITEKWLGESKLTNQCTNEIRCSEYEHRQNRRSEFRIIETQ